MSRFRVRAAGAAVAIAAGLVLTLRGQSADGSRFQLLENVGLPAVDEGLILRDARLHNRAGVVGATVRPGRVIVKFHDETAMTDRRAAVRAASATGEIAVRPSYADFDVVRIDAAEDAEAAAEVLRARPEVQYAQASHRVHAMLVPNDPLYLSQQWNLPMINMEKAWDIQPQAGSAITVAVIDTGMAYQNAIITATLPAFRDADGREYPALGRVTIPYSAAPQLVSAAARAAVRARRRPRPHRRAARLRPREHDTARLRGARHARQRHHRSADERWRRHRGRGLQRQADAGQGAGQRVGSAVCRVHGHLEHGRQRRRCGARDPLCGGQRRENSQHEPG